MPRLSDGRWVYGKPDIHTRGELMFGPYKYSVEELRAACDVERDRIMSTVSHGHRAWAFWASDVGEPGSSWDGECPTHHEEAVRLAELGQLTDEELADFKRLADEARPRIGTDYEQHY